MIFLDTSGIYALASRSDVNHARAKEKFAAIISSGVPLLTHNYVLVEALSLIQHRLGLRAAVLFESETRWFDVEWVTSETHAEAVRRWSLGNRELSFVDQVSFLVMQLRRVTTALAFDTDFEAAGFRLY